MDDAELDALEGAMEAWTEAPLSDLQTHNLPSVDIVNYLQTKKGGFGHKQLGGPNFAKGGQKMYYGFHGDEGPMSIARRPRRIEPIEPRGTKGGWDDCTVIPKLSPHRMERVFVVAGDATAAHNRSVTAPPRKLPPIEKRAEPAHEGIVCRSAPPQAPESKRLPPLVGVPPPPQRGKRGDSGFVQRSPRPQHKKSPRVHVDKASIGPQPFLADDAAITARFRALRTEIESVMSLLADSRAERGQLQKKVSSVESDLQRKQLSVNDKKQELMNLDKAKRRTRSVSSKMTQLAQQYRSKELKVADLRRMVAGNKKRLLVVQQENEARQAASAKAGAPLSSLFVLNAGVCAGPSESESGMSEEARQKALTKRCAMLKIQLDKLQQQSKTLQTEYSRLARKVKDVETKRKLHHEKIAKQQQALAQEMQRRMKQELENEAHHLKENHLKGLRYREREHQTRLLEEEKNQQHIQSRVAAAHALGQSISKTLVDLKVKQTCLNTQLEDLERRNAEKHVEVEAKRDELVAIRAQLNDKQKLLSTAEFEKKVAQEKLTDPASFSAAQAMHDKERQDFIKKIADGASQQQALATSATALEESIAKVHAQRSSHTTTDITSYIKELQRTIQSLKAQVEKEREDAEQNKVLRAKQLREISKSQAAEGIRLDRVIEELTQKHTAAKSDEATQNAVNTALLEQLDLAERLIAMHNLNR